MRKTERESPIHVKETSDDIPFGFVFYKSYISYQNRWPNFTPLPPDSMEAYLGMIYLIGRELRIDGFDPLPYIRTNDDIAIRIIMMMMMDSHDHNRIYLICYKSYAMLRPGTVVVQMVFWEHPNNALPLEKE